MYTTLRQGNKGKSVVGERFITTLKGKNIEKMTVLIIFFLGKVPVDIHYPHLTEDIETNPKAHNLKLVMKPELLSTKSFL